MVAITAEMKRLVNRQRLAFVGTHSADGWPHISPKGSLRWWDGDRMVWADADFGDTVSNLSVDPRTVIVVVDPFARRGYRFRGVSTVVRTGRLFAKALRLYEQEGSDSRRIQCIVFTRVGQITPLVSPAYAHGYDEVLLERLWEEYHTRTFDKMVVDLIPPPEF